MHLTIGLRWVWMMLLVDLAADVSEHLGLPTVNKDRASARTALLLAVVFWCLLLLVHLPMLLGQHVGPGLFRRTWLPLIGFILTRCAACFLTTIVALAAARECSRILKELRSARLNAEVSTW